ncbi:MAG TPA: DUF1236 domain-containing protein [Bradyrhizobium sp.]|nr:DUF1236 domain-containing protein [Bradyrhizobium sp.]
MFATTAIGMALATAAFAQSPNNTPSKNQPASQNQPSSTAPSSTSPQQSQSNQPSQSTSQPSQQNQSAPADASSNQSAGSTAPSTNPTASQAPSGSSSTQAQTPPAASQSTQQSANPPPANSNQAQQAPSNSQAQPGTNQAQQAPGNAGTAAQQPANTAQSSSTNVNASVNINDQQRTRISQSVTRLDVRPLTNVNFSISVGTVVPRDVHLSTLPADVVEIVPQYRGYSFVVVKDQIVIVEPSSYRIVATLPYSGGGSTAAAPARERTKMTFTDRDREMIRKHARTRTEGRTERRTTGSSARTELRLGERVPDSVEIEAFPDEVYRESPALREYRYIHRDTRTYVVEPQERRIIEEID